MAKTIYRIEGMHCNACVAKVTEALKAFDPDVRVTLNLPQAIFEAAPPGLETLNAAATKAGNYRLVAGEAPAEEKGWFATYYALFLILGMIALAAFKGAGSLHYWMLHFMAGFFLVFAFFKLLDLRGFQNAYAGYDLLAQRWPAYGLIYPFLELGLGFAFLFEFQITAALWFSLMLMAFSSLGVINTLIHKRRIQCACLGTVLSLPMSSITLIEDLGMAIMAGIMLAGT